MLSTYQGYLLYTREPGKALQRAAVQTVNARAEDYYRENIGKVETVDEFLDDHGLYSYAMKAYGLEEMTYAKAFMRKVLTSDLSDEDSFANKLSDTRYRDLADAFRFDTAGKVIKNTLVAQTTEQTSETLNRFKEATPGLSTVFASIESAYIINSITALETVEDLVTDSRLLTDVMVAYGLNASTDPDTIAKALKSDLSDPTSFVNQTGNAALKELVSDFNFDSTGKVAAEQVAQTRQSFAQMAELYVQATGVDDAAKKAASAESTYVYSMIANAPTLDALLKDARVVKYIGTAFGNPDIDTATMRAVLTSDLEDPKSTANRMGPKYHQMAASFAFTTAGTIAREPFDSAQSRTDVEFATLAYLQNGMETEAGENNLGAKLALYFVRKAPGLATAYDILADKALLKFAQTAFQLPNSPNIDNMARSIEKRLDMADLKDPEKLNKLVARFSALYDLENGNSGQNSLVLQLFTNSGSSNIISIL